MTESFIVDSSFCFAFGRILEVNTDKFRVLFESGYLQKDRGLYRWFEKKNIKNNEEAEIGKRIKYYESPDGEVIKIMPKNKLNCYPTFFGTLG